MKDKEEWQINAEELFYGGVRGGGMAEILLHKDEIKEWMLENPKDAASLLTELLPENINEG